MRKRVLTSNFEDVASSRIKELKSLLKKIYNNSNENSKEY